MSTPPSPSMPRPLLETIYQRLLSRVGLGLLLALLALNGLGLYAIKRGADAMEQSLATASQARQTMVLVEKLRTDLYQLLATKRLFLLSRDRVHLEPFQRVARQVRIGIADLRKVTSGRPQYTELVSDMGVIVGDQLTDMEKTITLAEFTSFEAAIDYVRGGSSERLMEYLDVSIDRIGKLEDQVRLVSLAERENLLAGLRLGVTALFGINFILILVGTYTIILEFRRRQRDMEDMVRSKEALQLAVRQSTAELRELSIHLQDVQESERHRLARELHDELGGTLSAIKLDVNMAAGQPSVQADEKVHSRLTRAAKALEEAIKVKRRIIEDLRPTLIDNLGYAAAFRWHCGQFTERTGCQCNLSLPEREIRLGEIHSVALFRVLQESLTNIAKYANATRVDITMRRIDTGVELEIADNGVGIEAGRQHHATSHGLIGMRERMTALEGSFEIDSAPGRGTRLIFRLPRDKTVANVVVV